MEDHFLFFWVADGVFTIFFTILGFTLRELLKSAQESQNRFAQEMRGLSSVVNDLSMATAVANKTLEHIGKTQEAQRAEITLLFQKTDTLETSVSSIKTACSINHKTRRLNDKENEI